MSSKIKDIEILELGEKGREISSPWSSTILLVKFTTDDGLVGFGEAPTTLMTLPVKESMEVLLILGIFIDFKAHF